MPQKSSHHTTDPYGNREIRDYMGYGPCVLEMLTLGQWEGLKVEVTICFSSQNDKFPFMKGGEALPSVKTKANMIIINLETCKKGNFKTKHSIQRQYISPSIPPVPLPSPTFLPSFSSTNCGKQVGQATPRSPVKPELPCHILTACNLFTILFYLPPPSNWQDNSCLSPFDLLISFNFFQQWHF